MRKVFLGFAVAGLGWTQSITEVGAAAATGTVGGAAGTKVTDGVTSIFGKVDQQTKAAANPTPPKPAAAKPEKIGPATTKTTAASSDPDAGPKAANKPAAKPATASKSTAKAKAAPRPDDPPEAPPAAKATRNSPGAVPSSVPDPPPSTVPNTVASKPAQPPALKTAAEVQPILPPPPPRQATAEDLKAITPGTDREDVLKLGPPASRITMLDDGHLLEIYSYATPNARLGVVRLRDGQVSQVELR